MTHFLSTLTRTGNVIVTSSLLFTTTLFPYTTLFRSYQANSGTLNFAANQATATITVLVNGDTTVEPNETFTVNLRSAAHTTDLQALRLRTFRHHDATPPTLAINDVTHAEGNAGTTNF